jgi:signal transduction histidine kinase
VFVGSAPAREVGTLKVMLVEDSRGDARLIREMLQDVDWFSVELVHVETLAAAVQRLRDTSVDVLLLDLGLPDSKGIETYLSARAVAPWAPIVVLSGDTDAELALRALREGAQDYLVKGHVDTQGLARALRYALEHKRIADDQHFLSAAGDLVSGTLEYEQTIEHVVRAAVPFLATAAVLELPTDDGTGSRVLVHDEHERREERLRQLWAATPAYCSDQPEVLWREIQELGFASQLSTELMSSERIVGRLTVLRTWSAFPFDARHATLLAELGQRCSAAIDKARLHRELQMAVRLRDEVLVSTTHDLRSPLSGVHMQVNSMRRTLRSSECCPREAISSGLDDIDNAIERSLGLLQELLDAAAMQAGREIELRKRPTDLRALVEHVLADHRLRSTYHQLVLDAPLQPLIGTWDPDRLTRVIDNLLSNATKYSLEPDVITVGLRVDREAESEWTVLQVSDRGLGIPQDELRYVFDRFYRGSNVPREIRGTGIGLWGVRHIVEQHGGTITVQSREHQGSTFSVRLPREA